MIYLENIYICLMAPMVVACFCAPRAQKSALIFTISGMTTCLLSSYINVFFMEVFQTDYLVATLEIAPLVEELIKLLPVIFYLIIFEPKPKAIFNAVLMTAIGFATFENICYLVEHGSDNLTYLLVRGFGAGAMHSVCGVVMAYGLMFTWNRSWFRVVGTLGILCITVTYHAEYNLLMSAGSWWQFMGLVMPVGTIFIALLVRKLYQIKIF